MERSPNYSARLSVRPAISNAAGEWARRRTSGGRAPPLRRCEAHGQQSVLARSKDDDTGVQGGEKPRGDSDEENHQRRACGACYACRVCAATPPSSHISTILSTSNKEPHVGEEALLLFLCRAVGQLTSSTSPPPPRSNHVACATLQLVRRVSRFDFCYSRLPSLRSPRSPQLHLVGPQWDVRISCHPLAAASRPSASRTLARPSSSSTAEKRSSARWLQTSRESSERTMMPRRRHSSTRRCERRPAPTIVLSHRRLRAMPGRSTTTSTGEHAPDSLAYRRPADPIARRTATTPARQSTPRSEPTDATSAPSSRSRTSSSNYSTLATRSAHAHPPRKPSSLLIRESASSLSSPRSTSSPSKLSRAG